MHLAVGPGVKVGCPLGIWTCVAQIASMGVCLPCNSSLSVYVATWRRAQLHNADTHAYHTHTYTHTYTRKRRFRPLARIAQWLNHRH